MDQKLLSIYMNDHLAGATVGQELARRAAGSNRGNDYGPVLEQTAREIAEDRESLLELMRILGVGVDRVKVLSAWVAERAGRLKMNGHLLSYSPLSRLVEIEALVLGVTGKLALWRSLQLVADRDSLISNAGLEGLIERAERQRQELDNCRIRAVADMLQQ
jgi:hypothetical protein